MNDQDHQEQIDICAFQQAKKGRDCCGDSYYTNETEDYFICAVADGLGSGPAALKSSSVAISAVKEYQESDIQTIMDKANDTLKNKRGSVLAIIKVYFKQKQLEYSCIGNVRFLLYSPSGKVTHPLPTLGYLSGRPQKINIQRFQYESGSSFLIHSDGLQLRSIKNIVWKMSSPTEAKKEIQQFVEEPKDDVTFLVGKIS